MAKLKPKTKGDIGSRLDNDGNFITTIKNDNIIKVYLKLKSEKSKRRLGFVNINTKTFHTTRVRSKHLFLKYNAYGFCYQLLADTQKFDKIRLKDESGTWLIPVSFLLDKENAKFLHFKGNGGFELQIFAPLDIIKQFKRPDRF